MLLNKREQALSDQDREILSVVQFNGRISISELSLKVGLSDAQTRQRLDYLESNGYIKGYQAIVNTVKVLNGYHAYLLIELGHQTANNHRKMEHFVRNEPSVSECFHMAGSSEYMLKVYTQDMESYRKLVLTLYQNIPDIRRVDNKPVLETIKAKVTSLADVFQGAQGR